MTAPERPRGSARLGERQTPDSTGLAIRALENLAGIACGVSSAPSAMIHSGSDPALLIASFGSETGESFPNQTVIPICDEGGRLLGTLTLLDKSVTAISEDQSRLLSGLARQAAALMELGGGTARKAEPIEAQFHDILELMPDAILIHGKGRLTYVNSAMVRLSGFKPAELVGRPAATLFAPETREAVEGRIEDAYGTSLPTARRTMRFRRHDGKDIPLEIASIAIILEGEECRLVVARDVSSRVEAEKSEARIRVFADIFRNIQAGLFVWQLEGPMEKARFRLLATNAAAARMTGLSIDDVIGKTMQEAFPGIYELGLTAKCLQVIATGESMDLGEVPYGGKIAPAGHYSAKIIPLPNDNVAVAFENVTEERRNREVLRQSVERFELIARATNDAVWEYTPATGETWLNERAYQLFGYPPGGSPSILKAWEDRLHDEDRRRVLESFRQVSEGGADTWVREYRILRGDGVTGHIYERGYVARGEAGVPVRMLGAMLDITELKRAEDAVRESEEKYRKLVDVIPDIIAIVVDGRITFINHAGMQFHGIADPKEVIGRPVMDFFHPDSRNAVLERLGQLEDGMEIPPMEHKFLRKDGSSIEAESRAISFPYQGQMAKLAVIRDITERKQAETALRKSEERYRLLFLNNPQPMWLYDTDSLRFLDVNEAAVGKYGYSRAEFLARSMKDIWLEEDYHLLGGSVEKMRTEKETSGVRRHRRKDGSVIHAEVFHHYIEFSGKGAAIALANDITEKLETLERLRHSEERYRTLAAVSPVGLYRTDLEGRCTYVNDHLRGILGITQDRILGRLATFSVHPDDVEWVLETWQNSAANDLPFHAEYRLQRPDKRIVWVMGNALSDNAPDGSRIGYVGTISDITERKQAEILLACQKRTLALVASGWHIQDVLDSLVRYAEKESACGKGCVLQLDAETRRLGWFSAPDMGEGFRIQAPAFPLGPEGGALGVSAAAKEFACTPDISADPEWTEGRDAAVANGFASCASRPILGSFGQVLGVFAFFYPAAGEPPAYDIKLLETASDLAAIAIERQRQQEISRKNQELSEQNLRIQEASRMKSEFLANMSHELRTPLNAIIGFSQLLIDHKVGRLNEKQSEYLGDILDGGMHLLRLINDVLDLAKIEAGKMQVFREEINLPLAMREVCDILVPMALGKGVSVVTSADPDAETAFLDGGKVRQVLYNLVSNAIKFSHPSGQVSVVARSDSRGGIRLQVIDKGIGIRKQDLGKLFQQFQQLDSGSARHYPGSGLGLVITKKLVELHRGTVEVQSEAGQGSTFTAVFPRHEGGE